MTIVGVKIKELYIVNYCNPNCDPLCSITRLPKSEAFILAKELSKKNKGTAFGRLDDFANYYPRRIITEEWLYNHFVSLGGEPSSKHPLYFVLQGSDYLNDWFGNGKTTKLLLDDIDSKHISFTFGDSMAKFDKPEMRDPFLKDTLYNLINKHDGDIDKFLDSIKNQYTYIEVQLWKDEYYTIGQFKLGI